MHIDRSNAERHCELVLGSPVDVVTWPDAVRRITTWAEAGESRFVCLCNVHSIVTAREDRTHRAALEAAHLVASDGAPVAWMLRRKGHVQQQRINGPDLMWRCCEQAAQMGLGIFLYGGTPIVLQRLQTRLRQAFKNIKIAGSYSPPFRPLSADEDAAITDMINDSGAPIIWVGLGCPKQEAWMLAHRERINGVMIGVGAAFDFHAGIVKRAPLLVQQLGLEWLHRLLQDPRRLARRYLYGNAAFMLSAMADLMIFRRQT